MIMETRVNSNDFYSEYHGHQVVHLDTVLQAVKTTTKNDKCREVIYLAGDSSLDNKHWFNDTAPAVNGYESLLQPPTSKQDIAYWLNYHIEKRQASSTVVAVNAAVEESTLGARSCGRLLRQDQFIRDTITARDTLVVSVGGNDIALAPTPCTIVNMLMLACCTPTCCIRNGFGTSLPVDDCCHGFGPSCASSCLSCPPGLGYFIHLFSVRLQAYINRLTSRQRPKRIVVCMIYFLDEKSTGSWADATLATLGYNRNPSHLQALIRRIFELAVKRVKIPETEVVAFPLFEVLNGKNTSDYCQRVEPSPQGGSKMANALLDVILGSSTKTYGSSSPAQESIDR